MTVLDYDNDWVELEEDELVRRLRNLAWPRPRPALRRVCLERISRRIAEIQAEGGGLGAPRPRRPIESGDAYGFSRRETLRGGGRRFS